MKKLVVAISSRALFDLDESHAIFETEGVEAFRAYQRTHEKDILKPGAAFELVRKFLSLNDAEQKLVEVLLISRNAADTGLRVFNAISHYGLDITRAAFAAGDNPHIYARDFGAHLFLSLNPHDVAGAIKSGVAAGTIWSGPKAPVAGADNELRIAFDGDAVLFSDEAEKIYKQQGLEAFTQTELSAKERPLANGPFKGFLAALHDIQTQKPGCIRTALVTARSAPAHERVVNTLRAWNISIDQALFLGGMDKGPFLSTFGADIFFDDQKQHCASAFDEQVTSAHVPYGIANEIRQR